MSDLLALTPVSLAVLGCPWFLPWWLCLFFFFFGEVASVVNLSSSVVYSGLVISVELSKEGWCHWKVGTPAAVTEVGRRTKGLAEPDRLLLVCPSHREESLLLSLRQTL